MNWLAPAEHGSVERQPLELHAEIVEHLASLGFGTRSQSKPAAALEAPDSRPLLPGRQSGELNRS